jgi:hypothetical protein
MNLRLTREAGFVLAVTLAQAATLARADVFPDTVFTYGFEACSGLECQRVACAGSGTTTISGTVFMPNGRLTLPQVEIYIPNGSPTSLPAPPTHARCNQAPSGHPIAATLSGDDGTFTLHNVPVGQNIPVVLLAGKWRRQVVIPVVAACTDNALPPELSRMPRVRSEGDIPHIAVATGNADSMECLVRKSGIDDSEFGIAGGTQSVHLFAANGADRFDAAHGGALLPSSTTLWANQSSLSAYDQALFACEGSQNPTTKPLTALDGLKAYADAGGRVQIAHWGNYWIQANAASWIALATWDNGRPAPSSLIAAIDGGNATGRRFGAWMIANNFATDPASIAVQGPKHTLLKVAGPARRMAYADDVDGSPSVQLFEVTTPVEESAQPFGRLVFGDMHPSGADSSSPGGAGFPSSGCHSAVTEFTPQDAALLYAMFDLERCVDDSRD